MSIQSADAVEDPEVAEGVQCDFCGAEVDHVSRIALDGEYERLRTPHKVQYACGACAKRKEADRQDGRSS